MYAFSCINDTILYICNGRNKNFAHPEKTPKFQRFQDMRKYRIFSYAFVCGKIDTTNILRGGQRMLPRTCVRFQTEDAKLQLLYDTAVAKCQNNLNTFAGDQVLVEGGGYEKIWLETQPMGGEMYAKHNITAALNNHLLFMKHQRADGRLAGSIQGFKAVEVWQSPTNERQCLHCPSVASAAHRAVMADQRNADESSELSQ